MPSCNTSTLTINVYPIVVSMHIIRMPLQSAVFEQSLKHHCNLDFATPLHQLSDVLRQIAREVVCLEHIDRDSDNVNDFDV